MHLRLLPLLFLPITLLFPNVSAGSTPSIIGDIPESNPYPRITLNGFAQMGYSKAFTELPGDLTTQGVPALSDFHLSLIQMGGRMHLSEKAHVTFNGGFSGNHHLRDLYFTYEPLPFLAIQAGQMALPFNIDNQYCPSYAPTIAAGSIVTAYFTGWDDTNPLSGHQGGRDIGIMLSGGLPGNDFLHYMIGLFNGEGWNRRDPNPHKTLSGSLTLKPLKGLEVSGTFYAGRATAVADGLFETAGVRIRRGESYQKNRWSGGVHYQSPSWSMLVEYTAGNDQHEKSDGLYLMGKKSLCDGLELIGTLSHLRLNHTSPEGPFRKGKVEAGVAYWLSRRSRLQAEYNLTYLPGTDLRAHSVVTMLQVGF